MYSRRGSWAARSSPRPPSERTARTAIGSPIDTPMVARIPSGAVSTSAMPIIHIVPTSAWATPPTGERVERPGLRHVLGEEVDVHEGGVALPHRSEDHREERAHERPPPTCTSGRWRCRSSRSAGTAPDTTTTAWPNARIIDVGDDHEADRARGQARSGRRAATRCRSHTPAARAEQVLQTASKRTPRRVGRCAGLGARGVVTAATSSRHSRRPERDRATMADGGEVHRPA